jgi:hypothetical protein
MEPKLTGYVLGQVSLIENAAKDRIITTVGGAGIKLTDENSGLYAKAEGGYGNAVYAKAEAGNIFSLDDDNKFGVKTAVGGQYTQATKTRDYYKNKFEKGANSPTWKANDLRGYGEVALTYNSPSFRASIGVQGGVKTCTQAPLDGIKLADVGETQGTEYPGRTTKGFVTPKIEIEAGKKFCGNLSFSTDAIMGGVKLYF